MVLYPPPPPLETILYITVYVELTCNAQPLATASSILRVVLRSFLKTSEMISLIAGTLQLPPTTSTDSISLTFKPIGNGNRML